MPEAKVNGGRSTPSANKLERNFDETSARWQFVAFTHTLTYNACHWHAFPLMPVASAISQLVAGKC